MGKIDISYAKAFYDGYENWIYKDVKASSTQIYEHPVNQTIRVVDDKKIIEKILNQTSYTSSPEFPKYRIVYEANLDMSMFKSNGKLPGGLLFFYQDQLTCATIQNFDPKKRYFVSTDQSATYIREVDNSTKKLYFLTVCNEIGQKFAYAQCWGYTEDLTLVYHGSHTVMAPTNDSI